MVKRIILILLLLASTAFGVPKVYNWAGPGNWNDSTKWDTADGTYPGEFNTDDKVQFDDGSGNCTLNVSPGFPLDSLLFNVGSGYDGVFAFGTNDLDVDGIVLFLNTMGTITAGSGAEIEIAGTLFAGKLLPANLTVTLNATGDLTTVSGNLAALIINHTGTTTFLTKGFWGSYTVTDGAVNYANFDLDIAGNFQASSAVEAQTNQGVWTITDTAPDCFWSSPTENEVIGHLKVNAAMTMTGARFVNCRKLSGSGSVTGGTGSLVFNSPLANWWDAQSMTINANLWLRNTPADPGSAITTVSGDMTIRDDGSWTAGGDITLNGGDLILASTSAAIAFDMNGHNLLCTDITIGDDENCTLSLGEGIHTVLGNITEAGGAQVKTIELETSTVHLGGTFNGTGFTVTASLPSTARIAVGDNSTAPTLTNVTAGSPVDASGVLDGGGNSTNIRFARGLVGGGVF